MRQCLLGMLRADIGMSLFAVLDGLLQVGNGLGYVLGRFIMVFLGHLRVF